MRAGSSSVNFRQRFDAFKSDVTYGLPGDASSPVGRSVIRGGDRLAFDHQPCRAVCQDCFDTFLRPLGMDGDIDSSGEKGGENRDNRIGVFGITKSDAILLLDAVCDEPRCQRRGLLE